IWHSPDGPRDVVIWCSNDYLGMAQHPKVVAAMVETAARMGTGAGGTRNIAGTNHPLIELERELAELHGKQAALVFTSGYVSNETGIATIAKLLPNCLLLSDALNHNSMIEGVRKSGSEKQIWRHNDVRHLKSSQWERDRHQDRAARLKLILNAARLPVMPSETHIVPLHVGDPEKCKMACDLLLSEYGIYIQPINYPTVPRGLERLRITPSPFHNDRLVEDLANALREVWDRVGLSRAKGAARLSMITRLRPAA